MPNSRGKIRPSFLKIDQEQIGQGDTEGAIVRAEKALQGESDSKIETTKEAGRLVAPMLVKRGQELTRDGDIKAAVTVYDRAVMLAPENGGILNSRGVARALTGDYPGAIEDFQAYIAWAPKNGEPKERILLRQSWIEKLQEKKNPFDEALLEQLKKE